MSYQLPRIPEPEPLPPNTAVLVASGDLRPSANRECWPAQAAMEAKLVQAFVREGMAVVRGHAYDPAAGHGFISSQRMGMDVFEPYSPGFAGDRRRGGVAIQPPRLSRSPVPSRADPDGRQLERPVARAGRPAEPERLPDQDAAFRIAPSGARISTDDFFIRAALRQWIETGPITHDYQPRARPGGRCAPGGRGRVGSRAGPAVSPPTRSSWGSSTKAAWACTTGSSTTNC